MAQTSIECLPVADAKLNDDVRAYLRKQAAVLALGARVPISVMRAGYYAGCVWQGDEKVPMQSVLDVAADVDVKLRVYVPNAAAGLHGVMLYMHGGGFTIGSVATHDALCRGIAARGSIVVVSVEYRLAPEHEHPAQVNDCITAYRWLCAHGAAHLRGVKFETDWQLRIVLSGDSAGGYLTLMLALFIRDHNRTYPGAPLPTPALLAPIYPLTDNTASFPSRVRYSQGYMLTADMIAIFHKSFLGSRGHDEAFLRATSPLHAPDLTGLPPTVCMTAEYDVLHDEGVAMVHDLSAAGNRVQHLEAVGCIHGFVTTTRRMPSGAAPLGAFIKLIVDELRRE